MNDINIAYTIIKDYETGDNSDIIATDSQKNTVYVLAKQYGVSTPEEFGLLLATHFVSKYPWVVKAKIQITAHPWERIQVIKGKFMIHLLHTYILGWI